MSSRHQAVEVTHSSSPLSSQRQRVTIVIPARNEAENIPNVERELLAVVDPLPYDFEFIVVDNCSTDATGELVKALCERDPRWKYIRFSRNFTVEMSITVGYHFATGDAIIVLYSDLQDPPRRNPAFLGKVARKVRRCLWGANGASRRPDMA